MKRVLIFAGILIAWLSSCLFTVDQAEYAFVTQFGRPVAIVRYGNPIKELFA